MRKNLLLAGALFVAGIAGWVSVVVIGTRLTALLGLCGMLLIPAVVALRDRVAVSGEPRNAPRARSVLGVSCLLGLAFTAVAIAEIWRLP